MKTFPIVLLISVNVLAWGAPELLPEKDREHVFSLDTKLDKKKGYQKALIWMTKSLVNSNQSIKLKDADSGLLIAKTNVDCDSLKLGSGFAKDQILEFTLEITAEDKKVEVKASDIIGTAEAYDSGTRPSKKEELDAAVKQCIQPLIDELKKQLN